MLKKSALALAASTLLLTACSLKETDLGNVTFYVTDGSSIYTLNSDNAIVARAQTLTGLNAGTELYALDVNPASGVLNGLGSDGQSYSIDASSGAATAMGAPDTSVNLVGKAVEMDYNPTVPNRQTYRVTTSTGENYRRNDTTGGKAGVGSDGASTANANDISFFYKAGDVNAGKSTAVSGVAYTNSQSNMANPPSTTIYALDSFNDTLAIVGANPGNGAACPNSTNPNCGQLTTVGALGVDVGGFVGFDILSSGNSGAVASSNAAYAVAFANNFYNLYSVNLTTGAMAFVSSINPRISPVRAFAVQP